MKPEPERHPIRPPMMPPFEGALARAEVKPMTIDPAKVTPEIYLLSEVSALKEKLQGVEKSQERQEAALLRIEGSIQEIKSAHGAMGWKLVGAMISGFGALLAAGASLLMRQLKGQ